MTLLLAIFLSQLGLPFSMLAGGAAPTPTPTATATATPTPGTVVATPVLHPVTGNTPINVSISCATAGATIFYTVSAGGTNPTHSGSTPQGSTLVYTSGTFLVSGTQEVRSLGYKAGLTDSAIAIGTYEPGGGR